MVKPHKTTQQQLDILYSRGVRLTNYSQNKRYLLTNNYYSIVNGYSRYFWISTNKYISGTIFDDIDVILKS